MNKTKLHPMPMKKALVIGGTKGFGAEVSKELKNKGYELITVARSKNPEIDSEQYECDIGDLKQWRKTLEEIKSRHRSLQALVCVVGYVRLKTSGIFTAHDWDDVYTRNLTYVVLALQGLAPQFKQGTKILTTGSQWSYREEGDEHIVPYRAAKHALRALTEQFGEENPHLTVVHCCVPSMDTPGAQNASELAGIQTHPSGLPPKQLADPKVVAKGMIAYLIKTTESESVAIDQEGEILPLPKGR